MCVCGGGSWREVIGRVGNAVESNLQHISHGPFGVQELLRKQERKRECHYIDVFSLDHNNQEVTEHTIRADLSSQLSAVSIEISIHTFLNTYTCIPQHPFTGYNNQNEVL